jgi:MFS family permease
MTGRRLSDGYLKLGHALDHLFMLIYPTVLLSIDPRIVGSYGEGLTLALGGFVAFGACSLPAGWLGDRWSRRGMMILFFTGIGTAAILTGLAFRPWQIAAGLTLIGVFAAIYHPVGIAMLVSARDNVGRALGVNGVAGNLGVALAALVAAGLAELFHWRAAFIVPGAVSIAVGIGFALAGDRAAPRGAAPGSRGGARPAGEDAQTIGKDVFRRLFIVLMAVTIFGGLIFNATTIAMPKVFHDRLAALTGSTVGIGALVSMVYLLAAMAQLYVGRLIDRHALRRVLLAVVVCQVPLLFLAGAAQGYAMLGVAIAMMFVVFGQIPINDAMVARNIAEGWRSRVYAVRYLASFGTSAAAVPLVGLMFDATGSFGPMFAVLGLCAAGSFVAVLFYPGRSDLVPVRTPR